MAEEMIRRHYALRAYMQENPLADRRIRGNFGGELFCFGMMSPKVRKAREMGLVPIGIGTYHVAAGCTPRGIYVDIILESKSSDDDDNIVWLTLNGDFRPVDLVQMPQIQWVAASVTEWDQAPLEPTEHYPIF